MLRFFLLLTALSLFACQAGDSSASDTNPSEPFQVPIEAKEQLDKGRSFLEKMDAFVAAADYEGAKVEAEQAAYFLADAMTIDPNYAAAVAPELARAYYFNNNYQQALTRYNEAVEADPNNALLLRMRAMTHFNLGQIPEGQQAIAQSLTQNESEENRQAIIKEMQRIGTTSFDFGAAYIDDGYPQKGTDYQKYGLALYRLAFDLEGEQSEAGKSIARQIVNWATYLKEDEVVKQYEGYLK